MNAFTLALLLSASFGAFVYFKLSKKSIDRVKPNLIAASLAGLFAFIILLPLALKFL